MDSDEAYATAVKESADYIKKNPAKPVVFLMKLGKRFPDVTWRVIWGDSVGTSAAVYLRLLGCRALNRLQAYERRIGKRAAEDEVEPGTASIMELARSMSAVDYLQDLEQVNTFSRQFAGWWSDGFDLLLSPSTGMLPPKLGTLGQACNPGQINVSEYSGKPSSHTVQNVGSSVFHLVAVENLRESGWSTNLSLSAASTALVKETRAFQIYEVKLDENSRGTSHIHSRPTVLVLISGDIIAEKKRLDQPGRWLLISEGKPHRVSTQRGARIVEIEVR